LKVHWVGQDAMGRFDPEAVKRAEQQRIARNRRSPSFFKDGNAKSFYPWWLPKASKKFVEQSQTAQGRNRRAETHLQDIKSYLKLAEIEWQSSWSKSRQVQLLSHLKDTMQNVSNKEFFEGKTLICGDHWSIPCAKNPTLCLMINEPPEDLLRQMALVFHDFSSLQTDVINLENELTHRIRINVERPIAFPNRLASGLSLHEYRDVLQIVEKLSDGIINLRTQYFSSVQIVPDWVAPILLGDKHTLLFRDNDKHLSLYHSTTQANYVLSINYTPFQRNVRVYDQIHPDPMKLVQPTYKAIFDYNDTAEFIKIEREAERHRETALRKKAIETFYLKNLKRDDSISITDMNACLERLLDNEKELKSSFNNVKLVIGTKYFTWFHGNMCIPHDWKMYD